ncbi:MAG: VWA domain-containing protein [Thermoanaerobaculia bacterium]
MRKPIRTSLALAALAVMAGGAMAPLFAATPQHDPVPALSETIDVRVVNLEAVVTDKGIPVHGLSPDDFRLKINGEEKPIEFFSEVRGGVALSPPAEQTGGVLGIPSIEPGEAVGTSYLVFIDDYFSIQQDRDRVLEALRNQLARLRPEDRMAVVAYDGNRLEMLSSWSSSAEALERAVLAAEQRPALGLQRWSERRSYELGTRLPAGLRYRRSRFVPADLGGELSPDEYFYARLLEDQIEREMMAVSSTLRGFGAAPGRRVAILLSGGWPYDIPAYVTNQFTRTVIEPGFLTPADLYQPLVETANLLSYTLYPVDIPGMQSSPLGVVGGSLVKDFSSPRTATYEREVQFHHSLDHLAKQTGGLALINSARNELVASTAGDTTSYYWLGFTPERKGDDGRWKVALEVTRPGVKVRTRRSFTDLSHEREISMAVESALLFGNPPSAQPLISHLSKGHAIGMHKMGVPLAIEVPSDAITMLPEGDHYVANLELRVAALDRDGASSEGRTIPLSLSVASPSPAQNLVYEVELELRRKTEKLVVSLYDKASGSILMSSLDVAL